jgi:hypothetical protein
MKGNKEIAVFLFYPSHQKPLQFHKREKSLRGKSHYRLLLPQHGALLLKNCGNFRQKKYALFRRRFSKDAFIDSFGGGIR